MDTVTIKEFQRRMFFYFKNLPIQVSSKGKIIAVVTSGNGSYQNKEKVVTTEESVDRVGRAVKPVLTADGFLSIDHVLKSKAVEVERDMRGSIEAFETRVPVARCAKCHQPAEDLDLWYDTETGDTHMGCGVCRGKRKR